MTFGERVVGALKLDANTFEDIERDPTAMGQAVGIIALAALASNLGQIWRLGFGVDADRRLLVPGRLCALVGGRVARGHEGHARSGDEGRLPGNVPDHRVRRFPGPDRRRDDRAVRSDGS